jgi:hypothetical protein
MTPKRNLLLLAVAFAFVGVAATVLFIQHQGAKETALQTAKSLSGVSPGTTPAAPTPNPPLSASPAQEPAVTPETPSAVSQGAALAEPLRTNNTPQKAASRGSTSAPAPKEPLKDPLAREALAFVGADPEAEAYWYGAINNPDLSAHERQDLIEDLNEDGLSDPKHPSPEDLPLIYNRILLIEEAGADAMDQVNADAFAEAYKDLLNLADLAFGNGVPVR